MLSAYISMGQAISAIGLVIVLLLTGKHILSGIAKGLSSRYYWGPCRLQRANGLLTHVALSSRGRLKTFIAIGVTIKDVVGHKIVLIPSTV